MELLEHIYHHRWISTARWSCWSRIGCNSMPFQTTCLVVPRLFAETTPDHSSYFADTCAFWFFLLFSSSIFLLPSWLLHFLWCFWPWSVRNWSCRLALNRLQTMCICSFEIFNGVRPGDVVIYTVCFTVNASYCMRTWES